jgi:sulfoxide reductase heme-binding subunit YedZ
MVLIRWLKGRWLRLLVNVGALVPLAWLAWDYWQGLLIVDPVREITTRTGKTALILLLLTLAVTPVKTLLSWKRVARARRPLGLYTFLYVGLHFFTFIGLDYRFDLSLIREAILDQRYVLVGVAAGLLMLPLAITSTKGWQRRLGKHWKRLHRLVYAAGLLAVVHFLWLVKDAREPLRYAVVLGILLAFRLPPVRRTASRLRDQIKTEQGRFKRGLT